MPALESLRSALQSALDESLATHRVPGAVLGVLRGDERLVLAGGSANLGTGIDTTPDTLFQVGSISKVYTATLVMQLVHAGLVELDEPVRGALQEFRVRDDTATLTITPRQLLSHTSGIQGDHFLDCGRNPDALWRYVSTLEEVGQIHAPDDMFSYCNAGYGVLGRLVEEATGDHYARALQRRLVRPLALERTVTLAEQAIIHRVAAGHHHREDGTSEVSPWVLSRFNVPIGGIIASADDLLTFAEMHLCGGRSADRRQVVPAKAVTEMQCGEVEVPGTDDEWGLGWRIERWGDAEVVGHDGDTVGQRTFLRLVPDAEAAIVVLTNSTRGTLVAMDLLGVAADEALGLAIPAPPAALPPGEGPDPDRCTGIYERMHQRLAIAGGREPGTLRMTIIPDELFVLAGMRERTLTLHPIDDARYVTVDPETGITHVVAMIGDDEDDDAGPVRYVHFGRRAHARLG
jgi:CubicO group peptidase (beta-lactamase class C family)